MITMVMFMSTFTLSTGEPPAELRVPGQGRAHELVELVARPDDAAGLLIYVMFHGVWYQQLILHIYIYIYIYVMNMLMYEIINILIY